MRELLFRIFMHESVKGLGRKMRGLLVRHGIHSGKLSATSYSFSLKWHEIWVTRFMHLQLDWATSNVCVYVCTDSRTCMHVVIHMHVCAFGYANACMHVCTCLFLKSRDVEEFWIRSGQRSDGNGGCLEKLPKLILEKLGYTLYFKENFPNLMPSKCVGLQPIQ